VNPSLQPLLSRRDGDLLRCASSTLVVVTHCVNLWVRDFYARHDFLSPGAFAVLLDQLSRFTVPAFFLLSGYGLAMQQLSKPLPLAQYYRHRMARILAPFFLWSAITSHRHWGFFAKLPWREAPGDALARLADLLFLRGFDYQYYFLIVIFQFYLIFPYIFRLARHRSFLIAALLLQMALMSPIESYLRLIGWQLPPLYSYLLPFFLFYCVAGVHAAWHPDWLSGLLRHMTRAQVWFLWIATLVLVTAEFWINIGVLGKKLAHADHFNRWVVLAYCAASFLLLLKHRGWLKGLVHNSSRWQWFFTSVAPFSFFVYLAHTHLLRLADLFLTGLHPAVLVGRVLFVLAGSYALGWTAQFLFRKMPGLRYGLGLPKES
jgi:surface polysaccharide O-acyltransferase-like enzyme